MVKLFEKRGRHRGSHPEPRYDWQRAPRLEPTAEVH
jgi:hypothetical protein